MFSNSWCGHLTIYHCTNLQTKAWNSLLRRARVHCMFYQNFESSVEWTEKSTRKLNDFCMAGNRFGFYYLNFIASFCCCCCDTIANCHTALVIMSIHFVLHRRSSIFIHCSISFSCQHFSPAFHLMGGDDSQNKHNFERKYTLNE